MASILSDPEFQSLRGIDDLEDLATAEYWGFFELDEDEECDELLELYHAISESFTIRQMNSFRRGGVLRRRVQTLFEASEHGDAVLIRDLLLCNGQDVNKITQDDLEAARAELKERQRAHQANHRHVELYEEYKDVFEFLDSLVMEDKERSRAGIRTNRTSAIEAAVESMEENEHEDTGDREAATTGKVENGNTEDGGMRDIGRVVREIENEQTTKPEAAHKKAEIQHNLVFRSKDDA